jgi:hypothetical protein
MMGQHNGSKRRVIRAALARLGMQARPAEVVAVLAGWGVSVTEALVRAVAFELRREAARAELHRARARPPSVVPPVRRPAKVPAGRGKR